MVIIIELQVRVTISQKLIGQKHSWGCWTSEKPISKQGSKHHHHHLHFQLAPRNYYFQIILRSWARWCHGKSQVFAVKHHSSCLYLGEEQNTKNISNSVVLTDIDGFLDSTRSRGVWLCLGVVQLGYSTALVLYCLGLAQLGCSTT